MGLTDTVVLAVLEAVPVPLCKPVPESVSEGVPLVVELLLGELQQVLETEAPVVSEAVGDTPTVVLVVRVEL